MPLRRCFGPGELILQKLSSFVCLVSAAPCTQLVIGCWPSKIEKHKLRFRICCLTAWGAEATGIVQPTLTKKLAYPWRGSDKPTDQQFSFAPTRVAKAVTVPPPSVQERFPCSRGAGSRWYTQLWHLQRLPASIVLPPEVAAPQANYVEQLCPVLACYTQSSVLFLR